MTSISKTDGSYGATFSSFRVVKEEEDPSIGNVVYQDAKPNRCTRVYRQESKQVRPMTAPLEQEVVSVTTSRSRDEPLDWQEERKQWISAAGVSTPADLELKLADMSKVAARNEVNVNDLTCHLMDVKNFLLELRELDKDVRRKKRGERSTRTRKRFRGSCDCPMECCVYGEESCACVASKTLDSETTSRKRATEMGSRSLLDPHIMRSFRNLIRSSPAQERPSPRTWPWAQSDQELLTGR